MTEDPSSVAYTSVGAYQAFGYSFEVEVDGALMSALEPPLRRALEGLRRGVGIGFGPRPPSCYRLNRVSRDDEIVLVRLERDGDVLASALPPGQALVSLVTDVNHQAIATRPDRLTVHAGAVSFEGAGILLPAPSHSGKSTLTAAMVSAGCDYLSDEAVSIDFASLEMEPYAKPLSLSPRSLHALGYRDHAEGPTEMVPASYLRPGSWGHSVQPRLLVFPHYEKGNTTTLTTMSRGEALVELANNSFNFVEHGGEWLPGLRRVVAACSCWRLAMGDAKEAAETVLRAAQNPG
jgi:hypothetical protein